MTQVQASQITAQPKQPIVTIHPFPELTVTRSPWFTVDPDGYSAFATITPKIDGAISTGFNYGGEEVSGEWSDAVKIDFILNITKSKGIEPHNATLYIKNDKINLYMALVVREEEFSTTPSDVVHFNFDNTNNKENDAGDDQLVLFGPSNIFGDLYFKDDGSSTWDPVQNGVGAAKWYNPFVLVEPIYTINPVLFNVSKLIIDSNKASGQITKQPIITLPGKIQPPITVPPITLSPIDPLIKLEPIQGTWVFEVAHPLNSADNSHDINASPGNVIGISATFWDGAGGAGGFPSVFDWNDMLEYQIAGTPIALGSADLSIDWIEVTQAVQDDSNSLPLARRKTTIVRAYIDTGIATGPVDANVFLYATDPDTQSTLPGPLAASVSAPVTINRGQITHTANFLMPTSWVDRPHLKLTAFVTSSTPETSYTNNWLPWQNFAFTELRPLNVYEVPINTGTWSTPIIPSDPFMEENEEFMQAAYPMELNFIRLDWTVMGQVYSGVWSTDKQPIKAKLNEVVGQIVLAWLLEMAFTGESDVPLPDLIYAFYKEGLGKGSSNPTWYQDGQGFAALGGGPPVLIMAHECNHNLDRTEDGTWGRHAGPDTSSNCGAAGPDPDWPYGNDEINEYGIYPSVWPAIVVPPTKPDYMSYCYGGDPPSWVSPYRWEGFFDRFTVTPAMTAEVEFAAKGAGVNSFEEIGDGYQQYVTIQPKLTKRKVLQVTGWLEPEPKGAIEAILQVDAPDAKTLQAQLIKYPWLRDLIGYIVEESLTRPSIIPEKAMYYELVAVGPNGNELYLQSFVANFVNADGLDLDRVYFVNYIPLVDGLQKGGRIELRGAGKTLDSTTISQGTPTVTVLTPKEGDQWSLRAKAIISWTAKDPDGDPMLFTVQYSPDAGNRWIPLASGITDTSLVVDPNKIPGTLKQTALVRVLASDGFNTGEGLSGLFYVPSKPPTVRIVSPVDGQEFGYGDIIPLKGRGYDLEDGPLPDSAFTWEFEGGQLGNGSAIDVVRLGPGKHTITLLGKDSSRQTGKASITINISNQRILAALKAEPLVRAGAGLRLSPKMASKINLGDSTVLHVVVSNGGVLPAEAVKLTVHLPKGLSMASESDRMSWKVIESGKLVEAKFEVVGKETGTYEINLEVVSSNLRPAFATAILTVGEVPKITTLQFIITKQPEEIRTTTEKPKTTTTEEPKTTITTSEESKPTTEETKPVEFISKTESTTKGSVPGLELVSALAAIPFLLWFRRRRRR